MKRRNKQIVNIVIPATEKSEEISFNIALSELKATFKKAIDQECDMVNFKVGEKDVTLEIQKVKNIIRMAILQFASQITIPRRLTNYITILTKYGDEKLSARDEEIEKLWTCLCSKQKCNAILVGEQGVGKTTMAMEVVRQIVLRQCPKPLLKYNVIEINTLKLLELADRSLFKYEQVLNFLLEFAKNNRDKVIFYIDNLFHNNLNDLLFYSCIHLF